MNPEHPHDGAPIVHHGPMSARHGDHWEHDAAELERRDEERINNPIQTLPNHMTTIDKANPTMAKGDQGRPKTSG